MIRLENVPVSLKERPQWVLWKTARRKQSDLPTKLPFQVGGEFAKSNDPSTWTTFEDAISEYDQGRYDGVGFVFSRDDHLCGIDLDGCRDPKSGKVADWAREIVRSLGTYAEVSPSQTGVKLFGVGKLPFGGGRKVEVMDVPRVSDKTPAIEVYDHGRFFAVTGLRLAGVPTIPEDCQTALDALCTKFWPDQPAAASEWHSVSAVCERARKYLAKLPPAVSGSGGHNATFHAACVLVLGFELEHDEALGLLREWNQSCQPQWSERELEHKIESAQKQPGPRGYLRSAKPENWDKISIPKYEPPKVKRVPGITTLAEAAQCYIDRLASGETGLIETSVPELDYALGGGLEFGEMVIAAARPSHGKSALALQCAHHWTAQGIATLIVSEEMSKLALGKRALQFLTEVPEERWKSSPDLLERDLEEYKTGRATCLVSESCGSIDVVVSTIDQSIASHGIQAVVIDYAQLLQGRGRSKYEQVSHVSNVLRETASRTNVLLLALCQLNREIEKRTHFVPVAADIRDAGTLEQDADVILLLAWPHKVDSKQPKNHYQIFVAKNRNRPINQALVACHFEPTRQMITETSARDMPNYHPEFENEPAFDPFP